MAKGTAATTTDSNLDDLHRVYARFDTPDPPPTRVYNRERRECTLEEVAQALGVSVERVRQIEAEALKKLRRVIRKQGLKAGFVALMRA